MSVKYFILLVVYLLVPLACNCEKKKLGQRIGSVAQLTFVEWISTLKMEGKKACIFRKRKK